MKIVIALATLLLTAGMVDAFTTTRCSTFGGVTTCTTFGGGTYSTTRCSTFGGVTRCTNY